MILTGTFTGTGQSGPVVPDRSPDRRSTAFNVSLWGAFVATVQLERSFDGGVTWLPLTAIGGSLAFTTPCSEIFEEPESNVDYRLNCTAYTSGTVNYRLSN